VTDSTLELLEPPDRATAVLDNVVFAQPKLRRDSVKYKAAKLRALLFDPSGSVNDYYAGIEGHKTFADKQFGGDMGRALRHVRAKLTIDEILALGWDRNFPGTTEEFDKMKISLFFDHPDSSKYSNEFGLAKYAEEYTQGDMSIAFHRASAALSRDDFKKLGWKWFPGTTSEFRQVRERLLGPDGNPRPGMSGIAGYIDYSDTFENRESIPGAGNMWQSHIKAAAALSESEFALLGWGKFFPGKVTEYKSVKDWVLQKNGRPLKSMMRAKGYMAFSTHYSDGNMRRGYMMVLAVLNEQFKKLQWGKLFPGTVEEYEAIRYRILNENGAPKLGEDGYYGYQGFLVYADRYHNGKMIPAYLAVTAVLDPIEFEPLNWKRFVGHTALFRKYRALLVGEYGHFKPSAFGKVGLTYMTNKLVAEEGGNPAIVRQNLRSVLTDREIFNIGWKLKDYSIKVTDLRRSVGQRSSK
jgi:hypothetical protein